MPKNRVERDLNSQKLRDKLIIESETFSNVNFEIVGNGMSVMFWQTGRPDLTYRIMFGTFNDMIKVGEEITEIAKCYSDI